MAIPDPDGPLALARRALGDAVHSLCDPLPEWQHGTCRWVDPLYTRLRGAMTARALGRRMVAGSRPPLRVDVLALVVDIDRAVRSWEPDGKGTLDRLQQLTSRGYRPQDCSMLGDYCREIERWVISAAELLGDRPTAISLRLPCPSCGARWSYRQAGAEQVRSWALRLDESGCACSACQASWSPAEFHWLARLLDCPALPT